MGRVRLGGILAGSGAARPRLWAKPFLSVLVMLGCSGDPGLLGDNLFEAKARFEVTCSRCHAIEIPLRRRKTLQGWRRTVQAMRQRGAELTDQEAEDVARYLAGIRGAE